MYPVVYEADYVRERNRLTTFFRLIVAIPWLIVGIVYHIAASVVVLIAWFALLITGRYPEGMHNFVAGILRFTMRVQGFITLQTDEWPPFGIGEEPSYPVRLAVAPRAEKQSRLKVFFRIILVLPLLILSYGFQFLLQGAQLISWLTIVFRGYQPAGVHNAIAFANGWHARYYGYVYYLTDYYPPVGDETPVGDAPAAPPAAAPPAEPQGM